MDRMDDVVPMMAGLRFRLLLNARHSHRQALPAVLASGFAQHPFATVPGATVPGSMWRHRHVSWIRTVTEPLALLCKVPSGSTWAMRNKRIPCNAIPNVSPPREPMKGYRQACLPSRVYPPQQALPVHKPSFHKHSEFAWAATMAHQALPVQNS